MRLLSGKLCFTYVALVLVIGIDTYIEVIVVSFNDLGSSPQPEGEAWGLWLASQVVNETTMTEIEVSNIDIF